MDTVIRHREKRTRHLWKRHASVKYFVLWFSIAVLVFTVSAAQDEPYGSITNERYARLAKGVNLSHWFWLIGEGADPTAHFQSYITAEDAQLLRDLGVRHVRIPIDVMYLFDWDQPDRLKEEHLPLIDAGIQLFLDHGIAVIVTPFGSMDQLPHHPERYPAAEEFWRLFAAHLRQYDPEYLFMQIANEPQTTAVAWNPTQDRLAQIIREEAPDHTIITGMPIRATADTYGAPEALAAVEPLSVKNVVYNMHFYEPFFFTLQGATWSEDWLAHVRGIPYPSYQSNMNRAADHFEATNDDAQLNHVPDLLRFYGNSQWNEQRLEERLWVAVEWASTHRVRLIVDEFGVYRGGGVREIDRLKYLQDLRVVFQRNAIAFTMWDYSGLFGLTINTEDGRTLDRLTAVALGLQVE